MRHIVEGRRRREQESVRGRGTVVVNSTQCRTGDNLTRSSPGSTAADPYVTHLDVMFSKMEIIDVEAVASGVTEPWYNQALCEVNSAVVRLGVIQGEYHWHRHDGDEMFMVLAGELFLDLAERSVTLKRGQGFVVPKGAIHRTRANRRTVILMIEKAGTLPAGD